MVDGIGDVDEFPGGAALFRDEKRSLQPRKLRRTEHSAIRVVGAGAGVIGVCGSLYADVAVAAAIGIDEDCMPAPLLCEEKLPGAVRAWVPRTLIRPRSFIGW